ncbi:hypothetical protein [Haloterrigena salinisoli]|uniref:hypothetical protein n=1 Tax=Haloterrigena salinisoli TaxID=3132747 RepID=UPI0030D19480
MTLSVRVTDAPIHTQGEPSLRSAAYVEGMDSKRPDVRLDDSPDEDGIVTKRDDSSTSSRSDSLLERLRSVFRR